jgi:hypothetical protein
VSTAENKARYEGTALNALVEASGHTICDRCYCCAVVTEPVACWECGGFCNDYDDEWDDGYCASCEGEGEIYVPSCLGRCNENGDHVPPLRTPGQDRKD